MRPAGTKGDCKTVRWITWEAATMICRATSHDHDYNCRTTSRRTAPEAPACPVSRACAGERIGIQPNGDRLSAANAAAEGAREGDRLPLPLAGRAPREGLVRSGGSLRHRRLLHDVP